MEQDNLKEYAQPKIVDLTDKVTVIATKDAPYHKEGEEVECSPTVAQKMIDNKWAKPSK